MEVTGGSQYEVYGKTHYHRNKERYVANVQRRRELLRARLLAHKQGKACADCGATNPLVLEFDHTEDNKFKDVSKMIGLGYSWERVLTEIEKCEIVCANCHRIRTHDRRNALLA